jgi:hypothetical protein
MMADDEPIGGQLTLRHWTNGRAGDFWGPDDYNVMSGGRAIGRIFRSATAPADRPWMWTITGVTVAPALRNYGFAETREEAKAAFAATWRAWLKVRTSSLLLPGRGL